MRPDEQNRIDVVITWVDGSDPAWLKEKQTVPKSDMTDGRAIRYRDWGVLQYLFRGLERFAPWVGTVHFVTWGHLPPWMNTDCPKLHVVNHKDFIPAEYLPTFNAHAIELNLHRIETLSERFVYFNDDMFLLRPMQGSRFFKNGLPCDFAVMNPCYTKDLTLEAGDDRVFYMPYNNINHLNRLYSMRECVKQHPLHWFHPKYGVDVIRNILLYAWPRFVGLVDSHMPQPYLKSSFAAAWEEAYSIFDASCRNQFRNDHDINHWYVRYRQLARGAFSPIAPPKDSAFSLKADNAEIFEVIAGQKLPMICVNDSPFATADYEAEKAKLQHTFEQILPEKSGFEK
ncbi:MAG: hypothetical protein GX417_13600 [Clostridiales bacterium]|nr:hypothetical protein [Clostridiales bacterium]